MKRIVISLSLLGLCWAANGQTEPPVLAPNPALPPRAISIAPAPVTQSYGGVSGNYYGGGGTVVTSSSSTVPPIVVRFSGAGDDANSAMEEDLNVMGHLIERSLERGLGDDSPDFKMGIRMLYSEGGRSVRAMYLDGFGALFMIKVGFPVFAPNANEPKEPAPAADSDWDKAKKDLYARDDTRPTETAFASTGAKFDPDQVDELKQVLLQALKNASNIRNLKPNDFVAVSVFGHPATVASTRKSRSNKNQSSGLPQSNDAPSGAANRKNAVEAGRSEQKAVGQARVWDLSRTSSQGTVLTIRVKKSDVDAFAKNNLDFEAFQKKAEQQSYTGSGYGVSSINSWTKSSSGAVLR
jgi:hypothetical protein